MHKTDLTIPLVIKLCGGHNYIALELGLVRTSVYKWSKTKIGCQYWIPLQRLSRGQIREPEHIFWANENARRARAKEGKPE